MELYRTSDEYLYNLESLSPQESRRLWKQSIKDYWGECAYCGNRNDLTLDHIIPQAKGGEDHLSNVICACRSCNLDKGHKNWKEWYSNQIFFNLKQQILIETWIHENRK